MEKDTYNNIIVLLPIEEKKPTAAVFLYFIGIFILNIILSAINSLKWMILLLKKKKVLSGLDGHTGRGTRTIFGCKK